MLCFCCMFHQPSLRCAAGVALSIKSTPTATASAKRSVTTTGADYADTRVRNCFSERGNEERAK